MLHRWMTVAGWLVFCNVALSQISDPLPDIPVGDLAVKVELVTKVSGARWMDVVTDGQGGRFGVDQRGRLYSIAEDGDASIAFDMRRITDLTFRAGQQGLNSAAFHPDFFVPEADGFGLMFTMSSQDTSDETPPDYDAPNPINSSIRHHDSVLHVWDMNAPELEFEELLRVRQPFSDHNFGQISFNPNAIPGDDEYGLLYLATGDGGNNFPVSAFEGETDPFRLGQDLSSPLGAMLRIDPLGDNSPNGKYGIPSDNPFVDDADENTLGEIWAYGLRNPHRYAWDTGGAGHLLISDIGQNKIEEINLGAKGANFGWSEREGTFSTNHSDETEIFDLPPDDADFGYTYPVIQYDHDEGDVAISGGYVYRGDQNPDLFGKYLFGDLNSGRIFWAEADQIVAGEQASFQQLRLIDAADGVEKTLSDMVNNQNRTDLRFGMDDDGEIYLVSKQDGSIRRLIAVEPPARLGDYNENGQLDAEDVDILTAAILEMSSDAKFDLNEDGMVDVQDRTYWIESPEVAHTYVGDSDLNSIFDEQDFISVFTIGKYLTGESAGWAAGDWDGNVLFDEQDFVAAFIAGGYLEPPRGAVAAVPEPTSAVLLLIGLLFCYRRR